MIFCDEGFCPDIEPRERTVRIVIVWRAVKNKNDLAFHVQIRVVIAIAIFRNNSEASENDRSIFDRRVWRKGDRYCGNASFDSFPAGVRYLKREFVSCFGYLDAGHVRERLKIGSASPRITRL